MDMEPADKNIDPDEIRAIRKGLGLSQVEAGELLGGGPARLRSMRLEL